jgi:hypothetical protein
MRYRCLAAVCVAALPLLGGSAIGHGLPIIPTHVLGAFTGATNGPNEFVMSSSGPLQSRVSKCEAGRTVKLYFKKGDVRTLADVDRSSRNGQWGVAGRSPSEPDAFIVQVTRKQITFHHRQRVCGADRLVRPLVALEASPHPSRFGQGRYG